MRPTPLLLVLGTAAGPLALAPAALAATAEGRVTNPQGAPVAHLYVRQEGASAQAFTDDRGAFKLALDPQAPQRLVIGAPGYQTVTVAAANAAAVTIKAAPVASVPETEIVTEAKRTHLIGGTFGLGWGSRWASMGMAGNAVSGRIDHELSLKAHVPVGDWLGMLDLYRNRAAIRVPDLNPDGSVTATPETVEAALGLGYRMPLGALELMPYGSLLWRSVQAAGVGQTGTPLDFNQQRQALGVGALAAMPLGGSWSVTGNLLAYPLAYATLDRATTENNLTTLWGGQAGLTVGTALVPGIRLEVGYHHDTWQASGYAEDADVALLTVRSAPEEVTP